MPPNLLMNVASVEFDDSELEVGVYKYEGKEQLSQLRSEHSSTHVFRREGGTELLAIPFVDNAPQLGDSTRTLRLRTNLSLTAALVRNALMQFVLSFPRRVTNFDPLTFLADPIRENLLLQCLPTGASCPDWLSVLPCYELSVRKFTLVHHQETLGLALCVKSKKRIDQDCRQLIGGGLDLVGRYVGKWEPHPDSRIEPKLELVGKVEAVDGDNLLLTDCHNPNQTVISSDTAFLERSWANFEDCLAISFRGNTSAVQTTLDQVMAEYKTGPTSLKKIESVASYLGRKEFELAPGIKFRIGGLFGSTNTPLPPIKTAAKAVYVFDPSGSETDIWHDRGIDRYGPYTSHTFTPTQPRICVVCQASKRGRVEQFVHKFLKGISLPNSPKRVPYEKGFLRKYSLDTATVEFFEAKGSSPSDYLRAGRAAFAAQNAGNKRWDLALIQIDGDFHHLSGDENPYLVSKAEFLTHQIPVQEFAIETVDLPDYRLGYALNNMALATYSKIGGIPWLLKANPTIAHELVIGLGSAESGSRRLGKSERVVGITTVFTGEGNYCLSTISQAVPYDDYQDVLLDSLKNTMSSLAQSMNWQPDERIRLVFHAFKPFKNTEADAVKKAVASLGKYQVEYAFLHVVEDHPFLLIDRNQPGERDYETRITKGVYAPDRGQFIQLSGYEVLLTLTGAKDVKRPSDGLPHPVLLRLGYESTFHDMTYLTRQVFTFASHSWRSFFPSSLPVTVMYSELIAQMLGNLATVSQWNSTVMLDRIGRTRWFL
jgi:hypothetical protein